MTFGCGGGDEWCGSIDIDSLHQHAMGTLILCLHFYFGQTS